MNFNSFVIRVVFLLLPGIIGAKIYKKLKGKKVKKDWEDYSELIVFSLFSYAVYYLIVFLFTGYSCGNFSLVAIPVSNFNMFYDEKIQLDWKDIFFSSGISVLLAFFAAAIHRFGIIHKIGRFLRVSKRAGETDVWEDFHNLSKIEWVVIRDHKVKLYYYCNIRMYSESDEKRELLLGDVSVYNEDGEYCYAAKKIYISREYFDLTIEEPIIEEVGKMNNNNNENNSREEDLNE